MAGVEFLKYTPGRTMRVKITSPTRVSGKHFDEGTLVDLSEQDGLELIIAGKAVKVAAPPKDK